MCARALPVGDNGRWCCGGGGGGGGVVVVEVVKVVVWWWRCGVHETVS